MRKTTTMTMTIYILKSIGETGVEFGQGHDLRGSRGAQGMGGQWVSRRRPGAGHSRAAARRRPRPCGSPSAAGWASQNQHVTIKIYRA